METKQGFTVETVKPFFMAKIIFVNIFLPNVCSSDVAVAYDLAKVGERVRLPSIALLLSLLDFLPVLEVVQSFLE